MPTAIHPTVFSESTRRAAVVACAEYPSDADVCNSQNPNPFPSCEIDMPTAIHHIAFCESTRRAAEVAYAEDPFDADNLTSWGSALLELCSYQYPPFATKLIEDAKSKFEEALIFNPTKSEAHWCLGNALTALAFLTCYSGIAKEYFAKASDHFKTACDVEPGNQLYHKSLEMAAKAPQLRAKKVQKQAPSSSSSSRAATKKEKSSLLKCGVIGLVTLVVASLAWVVFPKPPPSRRNSRR